MSRIGKNPISIPQGVEVNINGTTVTVKGKLGELTQEISEGITLKVEDATLTLERASESKKHKAEHGLYRALISNMVAGVNKGFTKELEIQGTGFRAQLQGQKLTLQIGFSHNIEFQAPEGITLQVPNETRIVVSGAGKQLVGQVAARIRSFNVAEPYKGKGIRYKGEHVRRKAGKTVA